MSNEIIPRWEEDPEHDRRSNLESTVWTGLKADFKKCDEEKGCTKAKGKRLNVKLGVKDVEMSQISGTNDEISFRKMFPNGVK